MIALLQRVRKASVEVNAETVASIDQGLLVLIGVSPDDNRAVADKLLSKLLSYRVFSDVDDKMNLSLQDVSGGLLLVPQFTLAADTRRGKRPSFTSAAPPALGKELFDYLLGQARQLHTPVGSGIFGADMDVSLINHGPVTFRLEVTA